MYKFGNELCSAVYDPKTFGLVIHSAGEEWKWSSIPTIRLTDGTELSFEGTTCVAEAWKSGITDGVRATYSGFSDGEKVYPYEVYTYVGVDMANGDLRVEVSLDGDKKGEIKRLVYPPRMAFDAKEGEGYTILPRMQGVMIPSGSKLNIPEGLVYERTAYMPIFAQVKNGKGWLGVFETPFDTLYSVEQDEVQPMFMPSLGIIGYRRIMKFFFREQMDMNRIATLYRNYLRERGELVTLKEKIARNPKVAELIGTPVVHEDIAIHVEPNTHYYNEENPACNDILVPFSKRAEQLRALKERGVDKAYLHFDGWGFHGYDHLHPDVFPIHPGAGGADGMRDLQRTSKELGYIFGIHDQYRDYYYDAETFDMDNAVRNVDGTYHYGCYWYGGEQTFLCSALAPDYVRRNYAEFDKLDIQLDAAYLDVFSVMEMDECDNPHHRVTREQCAANRRQCLDILTSKGIIPSSEEVLGCIVNSQVLCHHAPFFIEAQEEDLVGIPIPLLNLVYHDCIIVPWIGIDVRGGWGIPKRDMPFLWALICGGPIYYDIREGKENIELGKIALDLHRQVAHCTFEHELIDGNPRKRRSIFSDGTTVEVDMDSTAFTIRYPDGRCVVSNKLLAD